MKILLPNQEQQLCGAIRPREPFGERDRALIELALHTGLRAHGLCNLDVGQVLTQQAQPRQWLELVGKGQHTRTIPLNPKAQQAILDLVDFNRSHGFSIATDAPLLITRDHKRLPTRTLRDRIQRYRERADLDIQPSPHTFRHTMASRLAQVAPLPVVQTVLGHKRLTSTQIYTHTTPEQLTQWMHRLAEN